MRLFVSYSCLLFLILPNLAQADEFSGQDFSCEITLRCLGKGCGKVSEELRFTLFKENISASKSVAKGYIWQDFILVTPDHNNAFAQISPFGESVNLKGYSSTEKIFLTDRPTSEAFRGDVIILSIFPNGEIRAARTSETSKRNAHIRGMCDKL